MKFLENGTRPQPPTCHCNKALWLPEHTATHCNKLQHTATHCNTLQHTATHCNKLQHTATHCNTLQHTATHCSTLQHTATHCNTLQHTATKHCGFRNRTLSASAEEIYLRRFLSSLSTSRRFGSPEVSGLKFGSIKSKHSCTYMFVSIHVFTHM